MSQPTGPDHLKSLINGTLTRLIGEDPERDEDGDIPIHAGHSIIYVLPHPTAPFVTPAGVARLHVIAHSEKLSAALRLAATSVTYLPSHSPEQAIA